MGRVYNSLQMEVDEGVKRKKSGSQLLRNVHSHLAVRAGIDPQVIDFLQMRVS